MQYSHILSGDWHPTHVIYHAGCHPLEVMLTPDGVAYSRQEWDTLTSADYEVADGAWFFQGQPFRGIVELK